MSVSQWVLIQQNAPQFYWMATVGAIAHPYTRAKGFQMASLGVRATSRMAVASSRALLGTTLVRGGSMTVGSAAAAVGAGYAIGATVGSLTAYSIWGDEGAQDALQFYAHPISSTQELFGKF